MSIESYTYEDYIKDFELDYLGFDGTPDGSAQDMHSEPISCSSQVFLHADQDRIRLNEEMIRKGRSLSG